MPLRFFFDEFADEDVARGLRRRGVDVLTTSDLGRKEFPDGEQLEFVRRTGRVIDTTVIMSPSATPGKHEKARTAGDKPPPYGRREGLYGPPSGIFRADRHFLVLVAKWLEEGVAFPGLAYHSQGALTKGQAIRALLFLNEVYEPADMVNRVEFL